MASPFNVFRKHQRAMMAVIGVLCMIAFSIGSVTWNMLGDSRSPKNPVVVTISGHEVREFELHAMIQQRALANRFVADCMLAAFGSPQLAQRVAFELTGRDFEQRFGDSSEASVVRTRVLAQRAEQMGIKISDDVINEFLKNQVTFDRLDRTAYNAVVKRLGTGAQQIFNALRTELSADKLMRMSFSGHTTPAQRWDYYRRVKEKATVEVLPVKVEEFVGAVADPGEDTLVSFFEQYKDQEALPESPEPGFKIPKKAVFQIFKADYEKFYDDSTITDEEVKQYYEKNKDQLYRQVSFGSRGTKADDAEEGKPSDGAKDKANDATSVDETSQDEKPADNQPADDEPTDQQPAGEKAADENASEEKATEEEPTKDQSRKENNEQSSAIPSGTGLPGDERRTALNALPTDELALAVFDNEPEQPTTDAGAVGQAAVEHPTQDQPSAGDGEDKKAASDPSDEAKPAKATSSGEIQADVSKADEETAGEQPAGEKTPAEKPAPDDSQPKYEPLAKVEASIRKELAGQKAAEKLQHELQIVQARMLKFRRNLNPDETKPHPPNLTKLAEEHGLTEITTSLVSRLEFKEEYPDLAAAEGGRFADLAYGSLPVFQSGITRDLAGNGYLYWKLDEQDARVPELSAVRDEVVESWKRIEARNLALKQAEKLADEARGARKPLSEVFGPDSGHNVIKTKPFAWMTQGFAISFGMQLPPSMNTVPELPGAGEDFMRTVFSLDVGGVGVAMNVPKTAAYVVRVENFSPSMDLMHTTFMVDEFRGYASVSNEDTRRWLDNWMKEIEHEAQLTWARPADQRVR